MDKFASLQAFTKVAEAGSFAEAARLLGLSRSQVNRAVINLEDLLGVNLFNRTTRAVALTPTGQAFYERSKAILNDLAEAERAIQDDHETPQGDMKINAPMSFGTLHLGPVLVDFMQRYPHIKIQLILTDRLLDPLSEGFDMTVRIAESQASPSLIDHEIVEMPRLLCAAPSFLQTFGEPDRLEQLTGLPCLHYGNLPTGNRWTFDGPDGPAEVRVNGILCSNNAEVLCVAAVKGMGIALLPTFIAGPDLQAGRLRPLLTHYQAPRLKLCLIYPPNRHLSARVRLFVEFMHERFGARADAHQFAQE